MGQDLPAGTYTIKCAENGTSMEMHLVNDACGVEIYEDLSAYDAADSGLDDVPLPAGTVLFLTGNNGAAISTAATRRSMTCPPILPPTR